MMRNEEGALAPQPQAMEAMIRYRKYFFSISHMTKIKNIQYMRIFEFKVLIPSQRKNNFLETPLQCTTKPTPRRDSRSRGIYSQGNEIK